MENHLRMEVERNNTDLFRKQLLQAKTTTKTNTEKICAILGKRSALRISNMILGGVVAIKSAVSQRMSSISNISASAESEISAKSAESAKSHKVRKSSVLHTSLMSFLKQL